MADLYYHLDEKSESARKRFFADSSFSCQKAKISALGVIDPEKTPRGKILRIRGELRLADTELAATRSYRQIKAMGLVLWWSEKN